jgi:hypothetical protein
MTRLLGAPRSGFGNRRLWWRPGILLAAGDADCRQTSFELPFAPRGCVSSKTNGREETAPRGFPDHAPAAVIILSTATLESSRLRHPP